MRLQLDPRSTFLILLIIVCIGFEARRAAYWQEVYSFKEPWNDVYAFTEIAEDMHLLEGKDGGTPLYLWLVKGMLELTGYEAENVRFVSFGLSLFCILLIYLMGRVLFNDFIGLLAAFLFAVMPATVHLAIEGLRHELFIICISLFVIALMRWQGKWGWLYVGLTGVLLSFSSIRFYWLVYGLIFLFVILRNRPIKEWVMAGAFNLILMIPFFAYNQRVYNDANYYVNVQMRALANYRYFKGEFNTDKIKFPAYKEYQECIYVGERVTPLRFIFAHSFWDMVRLTVKGIYRTYIGSNFAQFTLHNNWILLFLYLLGLYFMFCNLEIEFFVLYVFLGLSAWLLDIGCGMWRHISHLAPFAYFAIGYGVQELWRRLSSTSS